MKKISIFGLGIISVLTAETASATEVKLFIGGNVALNGVAWSDKVEKELKDINLNLPTSFLGLGAEAGIRLKTDEIYNPGITLAYDYVFNSEAEIKKPASQVFSSFEVGFSAISATFDNYIRFSGNDAKRSDIVLGIGLASATERYDIRYTYDAHYYSGLADNKGSDDGTFVVFKLGANFEISDNIDFYANCRWFAPTKDGDVDALFNLSAGVKYLF